MVVKLHHLASDHFHTREGCNSKYRSPIYTIMNARHPQNLQKGTFEHFEGNMSGGSNCNGNASAEKSFKPMKPEYFWRQNWPIQR